MKEININAKVLDISEYYFYDNNKGYGCTYDGLIINTDKGKIKIGIDNRQQCCEDWSYKFDFKPHIVSKLGEDKALQHYRNKRIDRITIHFQEDSDCCFVIICFDKPETITMKMVNKHNGYYAHECLITIFDKEIDRFSI